MGAGSGKNPTIDQRECLLYADLYDVEVLKQRPTTQLVPEEPKRQVLDESIANHERRRAQKVQIFDEERHKYGQLWMYWGLKQRTKNNGRL